MALQRVGRGHRDAPAIGKSSLETQAGRRPAHRGRPVRSGSDGGHDGTTLSTADLNLQRLALATNGARRSTNGVYDRLGEASLETRFIKRDSATPDSHGFEAGADLMANPATGDKRLVSVPIAVGKGFDISSAVESR